MLTNNPKADEPGIDSTLLPTDAQLTRAATTPFKLTELQIQNESALKLREYHALARAKYDSSPSLRIVNAVDESRPPLRLRYVVDNVWGEGVDPPDDEGVVGCAKCKADMGQAIGCEYTALCDCLEFAHVNTHNLKTPAQWAQYEARDERGTAGLPKLFPYRRAAGSWQKKVTGPFLLPL
jgi:histone-lysine N-methyltransferase SUV39H